MSTTSDMLRVALVQMRSGRDVAANIATAAAMIRGAAAGGARYVQTPETTNLMELDRSVLFERLSEEERRPRPRGVSESWPANAPSTCMSARWRSRCRSIAR